MTADPPVEEVDEVEALELHAANSNTGAAQNTVRSTLIPNDYCGRGHFVQHLRAKLPLPANRLLAAQTSQKPGRGTLPRATERRAFHSAFILRDAENCTTLDDIGRHWTTLDDTRRTIDLANQQLKGPARHSTTLHDTAHRFLAKKRICTPSCFAVMMKYFELQRASNVAKASSELASSQQVSDQWVPLRRGEQ